MADEIEINPDWPQWRIDEAEAVNAAAARLKAAKARQATAPQSSARQGPSDLELRRMRREAEAKQVAAKKAADEKKSSTNRIEGKARNRKEGIDALLDEMSGVKKRKANQSTDDSQ